LGIFVGWILQRRWLTLGAFLVCVVGVFTLPRLPAPLSSLWLLLPGLLLSAVIYEGGAALGLKVSQRLRLTFALWMGFSATLLLVGIVLAGSNTTLFVVALAGFVVLAMSGFVAMVALVGRQARREKSLSAGRPTGARPAK
jgi:hypothetical protein